MTEIACGRIGLRSASECADKAARVLGEFVKPMAVCLSPTGHVTLENVAHAMECDLVGVYQADIGHMELWRVITGDLKASMAERGITPQTAHRLRVTGRQRAA